MVSGFKNMRDGRDCNWERQKLWVALGEHSNLNRLERGGVRGKRLAIQTRLD